jgi:DNA-binding NarL/FixJ family response regulator
MNTTPAVLERTETEQIKVVVVEDHLMVRKGVELLLRSEDIAVVGVADGVKYAAALIARRRPDVALVDIGLSDGTGIELTAELAKVAPATAVLLYTGTLDADVAAEAVRSGARGIALKASEPADLLEAIRTVAAGGTYFDPRFNQVVAARPLVRCEPVLSPREREVFSLLASGMNGEQVAVELVLSPETVRTHIRNAMGKLHATTRVHALALALYNDEISL